MVKYNVMSNIGAYSIKYSWPCSKLIHLSRVSQFIIYVRERERCVGMDENGFTLIIIVSSYLNLEWVYGAGLWDKFYYLLLEVVPFGMHVRKGSSGVSLLKVVHYCVVCLCEHEGGGYCGKVSLLVSTCVEFNSWGLALGGCLCQ